MTIQSDDPKKVNIEAILDVLNTYCDQIDLRRLDETKNVIEASFIVESQSFSQLNKAKYELQKLDDSLKIVFLDNKGLL